MSNLKNLIFDFGDVFINLDKTGAINNALQLFGLEEFPDELIAVNALYEQGLIDTEAFLNFYSENFRYLSKSDIVDAWNFILKDFPMHRLKFIQKLAEKSEYRLFLLSNTNALHIEWIEKNIPFYNTFKACFEQFYLSHEIQLRKPNADIFQFVLAKNKLKPEESLFIDDTAENTSMAKTLGLQVWNIDETTEDVTDLFTINKALF